MCGRSRWVLAALGVSLPARAEPPETLDAHQAYRLSWSAPAGCPTHDNVVALIGRLLVESRLAVAASLEVSANITEAVQGSFDASVVYGAHGTENPRRLHASTCDALASATALIIATAIDPAAAERAAKLAAEPASDVAPLAPAAPSPTRASAPPVALSPRPLAPFATPRAFLPNWSGLARCRRALLGEAI